MRPPYFAFYPADFANDIKVEVMCTRAVGAYILLLCKAWQSNPPASLPNDDQILARLARLDAEDWAGVKAAVLACFELRADGRLHQARLRREYDTALRRMRIAKDRGRKGGLSKAAKSAHPEEFLEQAESKQRASRVGAELESSSASPISNLQSPIPPEEIHHSPSESGGEPPPTETKLKKPRKTPDTNHHRAVAIFCESWKARYGVSYPFSGGKDGVHVKDILLHLGGDVDRFAAVVSRFLADRDPFVADKRHPLGMLKSQLQEWIVEGSGYGGTNGVGRAGRVAAPTGKYDHLDRSGLAASGSAANPGSGGEAKRVA